MCSIESHEIYHSTVNYYASSGGGIPLTPDSSKSELVSFGLTINFIDICLNHSRQIICVEQQSIVNIWVNFSRKFPLPFLNENQMTTNRKTTVVYRYSRIMVYQKDRIKPSPI